MHVALSAATSRGAGLVALAETLADRITGHREAGLAALHASHYATAPIPASRGGLGVASVHDLLVATSRLGRAGASVALDLNAHLVPLTVTVRAWRRALRAGELAPCAAHEDTMRRVAREGLRLVADDAPESLEHELLGALFHAAALLGVAERGQPGRDAAADLAAARIWLARLSWEVDAPTAALLADARRAQALAHEVAARGGRRRRGGDAQRELVA